MGARTTVDVATLAARLRLSTTRLARLLRQEADTGLSPSQLSALATIEKHGPLTLGALAEIERVAPPTITKVLAKLREHGLVARHRDSSDGRVALVSTTAAGNALLRRSRERKNVWLAERVAALDVDARARLAGALDALETLADVEDAP